LACILALDGFYMDGRNVRASYGTSKYCSAFIKNVRCSNPDCTYLHQMGDIEDTFTKQEIQAGYVTSGRDVLARQQQIVQQALSAASGAAGSVPRRRIGCGGPSGTGKAASTPIFPQPTFDEPAKAPAPPPPPVPVSVPVTPQVRSATTGGVGGGGVGFPPISSVVPVPTVAPTGTLTRAATTGVTMPNIVPNVIPPAVAGPKSAFVTSIPQPSRNGGGTGSPPMGAAAAPLAPAGATAASVVAGVHNVSGHSDPPALHTTLTPLTPLKRTNVSVKGQGKNSAPVVPSGTEIAKLSNMKTGALKKANGLKFIPQSSSPTSSDVGSASSKTTLPARVEGVSTIGGDVIATPLLPVTAVSVGDPIGTSFGLPTILPPSQSSPGIGSLSELVGGDGLVGLGGEVFNGPLQSSSAKSAIGAGIDKWNVPGGGNAVYSANQSGLWGGGGASGHIGGRGPQHPDSIGGGVIGGGTIGHSGFSQSSGSSALASMLGINLPTGSGSLRESTNLWMAPATTQHASVAALNGNSFPIQGVIGGNVPKLNNGPIGGLAIGGGDPLQNSDQIGNGGNKSDIALLQSLLPGVHITSGGSYQGNGFGAIGGSGGTMGSVGGGGSGSNNGGWNSAQGGQGYGGSSALAQGGEPHQGFGLQSNSFAGQPFGSIGQGHQKQRQAPGSIW
jgi:hypothetical protein